MGAVEKVFISWRWKIGCRATCTSTSRSPLGPPFFPGSPLSRIRMLWPSSMPAGTDTWIFFGTVTYPLPWQEVHLSLITFPVPLHSGQVCTLRTMPNSDCCVYTTCPSPLHLGQVSGCVPGFAPVPLQVVQVSF